MKKKTDPKEEVFEVKVKEVTTEELILPSGPHSKKPTKSKSAKKAKSKPKTAAAKKPKATKKAKPAKKPVAKKTKPATKKAKPVAKKTTTSKPKPKLTVKKTKSKSPKAVVKKKKPVKLTEAQQKVEIEIKEVAIQQTTATDYQNSYVNVELEPITDTGVKGLKQIQKRQKQLTSKYSKEILNGKIVSTTNYQPNINKHVIELHDVTKSYLTGDIETQVLKGIDIKLDKSDFIVILGPSGSGKTTFLNIISGLDKATKGDVFVLGYNLTLLKDSHLTKFRRKHVGFIFQQYNLLTNLTAKENAEVGENLAESKTDMGIDEIFETIGMKEQMDKYPHQMSGGQQQRVSIARALAKNPDMLFADEPTGALDEEMGRKVLQILVTVNKKYKTTVIVVTHNPNIAKIGNTVIHIKNGLVDQVIKNPHPADPETIDWS